MTVDWLHCFNGNIQYFLCEYKRIYTSDIFLVS